MPRDWVGNKAAPFATLAANNHSNYEREENDFYAIDPIAIDHLINDGGVKFTDTVLEPSAGLGHLSERLKEFGYKVISKDLVQRDYELDGLWDFLTTEEKYNCDIVMNPPYKFAKSFIEKALTVTEKGNNVWAFVKIQFLEGKARRELYNRSYLKDVYVFSSRINCANGEDFSSNKSSAVCYCWMRFCDDGVKCNPQIHWIN